MRKGRLSIWTILALAAVSVEVMFFGYKTFGMYQEKQAAETAIRERATGETAEGIAATAGKVIQTVQYRGETYKRNSYMKAILCIGVDKRGSMHKTAVHGQAGQADGLFLVARDTARNEARILMIPRDTMTEITLTDLAGNELGEDIQHITLAYAYGNGGQQSCEYMKRAVSGLLGGLVIDSYMAIDMDALGMINDAVGGVPVTIQDKGLEQRSPAFRAGETVLLKGDQAEAFLRYRDINIDNSALSRMERQKQYMLSYYGQAVKAVKKDSEVVGRLIDEMQEYMITDMKKDEYVGMILDLLGKGKTLEEDDIFRVPGEGVATGLYDEFHADRDRLEAMVLDLFYRKVD